MLHVFAIEVLLKLGVGLALVLIPLTTIKVLGLPRSETAFWPRLLGATLIGLSAALYMEARLTGGKGLALAGANRGGDGYLGVVTGEELAPYAAAAALLFHERVLDRPAEPCRQLRGEDSGSLLPARIR